MDETIEKEFIHIKEIMSKNEKIIEEEMHHIWDALNKHIEDNKKTKEGIYRQITVSLQEQDAKIAHFMEVSDKKDEIMEKTIKSYRDKGIKALIKIIITASTIVITALVGFIVWLFNFFGPSMIQQIKDMAP